MSTAALHAKNGDVRIAYDVRGTGDPVLLVHGLGYDRFGWGDFANLLARSFSVVSFDNRGVGGSDAPPGPYTVGAMADDALAVLDATGIERAHVFGASLGGMIAQRLALDHPARVAKLVLACTWAGGARSYPLPERTQRLFALYPTLSREEALRRMVENSMADAAVEARPDLVDRIYRYRLEHAPPVEPWAAQAAAGAAYDAGDSLSRLAMPTLVVAGDADNVVDPRNAELLGELIPNARVEIVPGGGHLFMWEQPERLAEVVEEFLG
jgi:pimeloyl-ACP methyl ester carboxylesterase